MELYIVRHGLTEWNLTHRFQGCSDIALAEPGREAARQLGKELEKVKIDLIYSSPLQRAFETACLIRGDRDIEIKKDNRIRELSFGEMEGCTFEEWDNPEKPYRFFFQDPEKYIEPKGGESVDDAMIRGKSFIKDEIEPLAEKHERVMIVAHGAINKAIMCYLENNDKAHYWGDGLQKNCQATIFRYEEGTWTRE